MADPQSTVTETTFRSQSTTDGAPGYRERAGQRVTILGPVDPDEDVIDLEEEDVSPIYRIRFDDGIETEAFADELDPPPGTDPRDL